MLTTHAHTLDAIFNDLARRAKCAEYLSQFEAYLRLGLNAQAQCRATLETLAAIKNPTPVAIVRQANIANGPQQVNNAPTPVAEASRGGNLKISQTNYWSNRAMNGWTAERCRRQSALIHLWRPWEKSTGPQTVSGKTHVAGNAFKGGTRALLRQLAKLLRQR
jgi:hypothetical protein